MHENDAPTLIREVNASVIERREREARLGAVAPQSQLGDGRGCQGCGNQKAGAQGGSERRPNRLAPGLARIGTVQRCAPSLGSRLQRHARTMRAHRLAVNRPPA